jgi:hypothetical protein
LTGWGPGAGCVELQPDSAMPASNVAPAIFQFLFMVKSPNYVCNNAYKKPSSLKQFSLSHQNHNTSGDFYFLSKRGISAF